MDDFGPDRQSVKTPHKTWREDKTEQHVTLSKPSKGKVCSFKNFITNRRNPNIWEAVNFPHIQFLQWTISAQTDNQWRRPIKLEEKRKLSNMPLYQNHQKGKSAVLKTLSLTEEIRIFGKPLISLTFNFYNGRFRPRQIISEDAP